MKAHAPFPVDAAAREAATDPTRNVVLRASAGTGKTTVLTDRYVRLVENGVPPRNILALTFTRKAAQEMKDRIVGALRDPARRAALAGRTDIAEVNISTLDAFTLGLIREFPLDAGVNPGIEVLDERSMPVIRELAIERVFSGATGFDLEVLGAAPLLLDRSAGSVRGAVATYMERRLVWRRNFEAQAEALASRPAPEAPCLSDFFQEASSSCEALLAAAKDSEVRVEIPLATRLALRLDEQDAASDALDREALEAFFLKPKAQDGPKKPPNGLRGEARDAFIEVAERVSSFRTAWLDFMNARAFGPLWAIFQAVEAEYQRLKRERGVMDFDDLTLAATKLLGNLGEFSASRFRLEARYHHLLLDEFHDTSDHQWELLQAIIAPWKEGMGLTSEEVSRATDGRLTRPTIFVVGDHKQSIYRFRDARVEILGRAEAEISALGEAEDDASEDDGEKKPAAREVLRWNFRSNRRLRRFFNSAFRRVAERSEVAADADWAFRYDDDDALPEDESPNDEDAEHRSSLAVAVGLKHEEIAERIAERVRSLIEDEGCPPKEIAVLARASTNLSTYRDALEDRGVPAYLMKGQGFFDTSELRDLRALCRYLARPHSDRRAVELLRSRFFALPADDLVRLKRAKGVSQTPFADLLRGEALPSGIEPECAARLRSAGSAVSGWLLLARRRAPWLAVGQILEESRYLDRARASAERPHEGEQQAANIKKALELLRSFGRGGFPSMERVAERLAGAASGDATQAPLEAGGAVQLLSIHAAKGLEFDHVFLVDCGNQGGGDYGIPRIRESGPDEWGIALVQDAAPWRLDDGGRAESEERRCLYVAMTRARKHLTLSWTTKMKNDGTPWSPRGLAKLLPANFFHLASMTAKKSAKEPVTSIEWDGHQLEVLRAPPETAEDEAPDTPTLAEVESPAA